MSEMTQSGDEKTPDNAGFVSKALAWLNAHRLQLVGVLIWVVVIVATRQYMTSNELTFGELTRQLQDLIGGTWYGPIIYIIAYLARPIILFPASLLTILAGNIYGLGLGYLYALIAGTLSATIPYIIGRWFAPQGEAKEEAEETGIQKFIGLMKRNPFQAVLTMRLIYLPYDPVSFVAGSLKIPFWQFFLATLIGNIPGAFTYVAVGASIEGDITRGEVSLDWRILAVSAVVLVVSLGISQFVKRRQRQNEDLQGDLATSEA